MQSQDSKLDQEQIIESFQDSWTDDSWGPDAIVNFLSARAIDRQAHAELVSELIEIDIELAWHCWCRYVEKAGTTDPPNTLKGKLHSLPRLSGYLGLIEALQLGESARREIARFEWEVREAFGDAIPSAHYLEQYGINLRIPNEKSKRYFVSDSSSRIGRGRTIEANLRGRTILGRQRSTDAADLQAESTSSGVRIIVADRNEARVSREHIAVQILTPDAALVENLSGRNAVLLSDGNPLQPNEIVLQRFPFVLQFPHQRFRLR